MPGSKAGSFPPGAHRQDLPCEDDDPGTYEDHCEAGQCVGTECECTDGP